MLAMKQANVELVFSLLLLYGKNVKIGHLQNMLISHSEKQNLAPRNQELFSFRSLI